MFKMSSFYQRKMLKLFPEIRRLGNFITNKTGKNKCLQHFSQSSHLSAKTGLKKRDPLIRSKHTPRNIPLQAGRQVRLERVVSILRQAVICAAIVYGAGDVCVFCSEARFVYDLKIPHISQKVSLSRLSSPRRGQTNRADCPARSVTVHYISTYIYIYR